MHYLADWATLAVLMTMAAMSPGPDFVVAVRNSISHSRRAGIFTALGFGLGILVHATYTMAGLAAVIAHSVALFNTFKFAGALYLMWIGVQALRSRGFSPADDAFEAGGQPRLSSAAALRMGFLTNLLNPKATMFFLAVFSQLLRPDVPLAVQFLYGLTSAVIVAGWFTLVATVLTVPHLRQAFQRASRWIDRATGGLLIGLGIKLLFLENRGMLPNA